jgi:hypothetical protein
MKENTAEIRRFKDVPDYLRHEVEICIQDILDSYLSILEKNNPTIFFNSLTLAHLSILDSLMLNDEKKLMYLDCIIKNLEAHKDRILEEKDC